MFAHYFSHLECHICHRTEQIIDIVKISVLVSSHLHYPAGQAITAI